MDKPKINEKKVENLSILSDQDQEESEDNNYDNGVGKQDEDEEEKEEQKIREFNKTIEDNSPKARINRKVNCNFGYYQNSELKVAITFKIADLEISDQSLLTINEIIETTVRHQAKQVASFKNQMMTCPE